MTGPHEGQRNGGTLPAHSTLAFKLYPIMDAGGGSANGLQWHVADNYGDVQYSLADSAGGADCGPVPEGKALTW